MVLEHNFEICQKLSNRAYKEEQSPLGDWLPITFIGYGEIKSNKVKEVPVYHNLNLACIAYRNDKTKEVIIAFRGTEQKDCLDFVTDFQFVFRKIPAITTNIAKKAYNQIKAKYKDYSFYLTGHSLGGAYAQILGAELIRDNDLCRAIAFNPPGTNYALERIEKGLTPKDKSNFEKELASRINNYVIMNDFVGNFQAHIGSTYYIQPFPLDKHNADGNIETPHNFILEYTEANLGNHIPQPAGFFTANACALWCFDVNNRNSGALFWFVKKVLDVDVSAKDLEKALKIIEELKVNNKITLLNSFKYKTERKEYELKVNV